MSRSNCCFSPISVDTRKSCSSCGELLSLKYHIEGPKVSLSIKPKPGAVPVSLSEYVNELVFSCHVAAVQSGWWAGVDVNFNNVVPTKLCLIHSEISEAMEGHRKNEMDQHLPHRKSIEVELADALIRIADLAGAMGLDLGGAVVEKMAYNKQRADHKTENRAKAGGKSY